MFKKTKTQKTKSKRKQANKKTTTATNCGNLGDFFM